MGNMYFVAGIVVLHFGMLVSFGVCTSPREKRQQQNMAQVLNTLRSQLQTYDRSLAECRRHIQLLTGKPQITTNNRMPGFGGWRWRRGVGDKKRRRSVNTRQVYYGNYWSNNYNHLQTTLQTRIREFNQCVAQLQSIRTAQEEIRNKQQVATHLLQQINNGAINLRTCVSMGGRTSVNLPTLFGYVSNGGFIQSQKTQPSHQVPASNFPWIWTGGFGFDDRRRAVMPSSVDWTQVLAQRQQWLTFVQQELVKCWVTIGRLSDGSLPTRAPVIPAISTSLPPQPPPPNRFPPQPPPPLTTTTVKPTPVATTPPPTSTTTRTTTVTITTTTKPTSTTTRTTTTTAPTTTPTTITTTLPTTTTKLTPTTAVTTQPLTTTVPLTTTTVLPSTTTTINFTSSTAIYFTTTTGPGLTTTFAPLMTTSPC